MRYIVGQNREQEIMFPSAMDDYVAEDNSTRVIDAFVDSLNLNEMKIQAEPNVTGRPSYDPRDQLKLFIYGYFNSIRSSRKLERESGRNIELIWLLKGLSPDHKTISRFRKDNAKALKNVFRAFVKLCNKLGLYGLELAAIDGSKFKAVNSKDKNYNKKKLEDLINRIDNNLEKYMAELDENDDNESDNKKFTKSEIEQIISELKARKSTYESMQIQLEETDETQISSTDPDAKRMINASGGHDVSYNIQSAVDDKNNMIAEYEITNKCTDSNLLADMAIATKETLNAETLEVVADNGYFASTDIVKCINNGIIPHVSSEHDSYTFCTETTEEESNPPINFDNQGRNIYLKDRNIALCPMGQILYPKSYTHSGGYAIFTNPKACRNCTNSHKCFKNDRRLRIRMAFSEFSYEYNDKNLHTKQILYNPDKIKLRKRKTIVEHPFGTIKRGMNSAYCLLKGIEQVRGEFALTFLAYNLKRAINILGTRKLLEAIVA